MRPGFVHWGATSQDAMDTGLVLQLRAALAVIDADLERLVVGLTGLRSSIG
jgi:3-carboxy-cis,cis-muconate cycloisomerase